jgi:dTDP-4-amino-4,6-dideoxygalactose transaminase
MDIAISYSEVQNFQDEFAAFCGVKHAIALANGSVALELALYALNIGPGDEVIVAPRTFIASASCAVLRGAKPVFADVDPESQNIAAESIRKVITPRTRAIIPVHLAGWPCDMDPILEVAEEYGLKMIEDCAQCHGAVYYSRRPWRNADAGHGATGECPACLLQVLRFRPSGAVEGGMGPGPDHERRDSRGRALLQRGLQRGVSGKSL